MKTHNLKKGLIPLSIFLLLMLNFIPIVNADEKITLVNWDSDAVGEHTGIVDNVEITRISGTKQWIVSETLTSSPNSYYLDDGDSWINLTSDYDYISSINISFKVDWVASSGQYNAFLVFYNDSNEVLRINFYKEPGSATGRIRYQEADDSWVAITGYFGDIPFWLNISHVISNTMNYTTTADSGKYSIGASRFPDTWTSFDSIFCDMASSDPLLWIDDIIIDTTIYEEEEVAGYDPIGDLSNIHLFANTYSKYLEVQKNTYMQGYVKAVDLFVDEYYFDTAGNTLTDLTLKVNGIEKGSPTVQITVYAGYIVRWLFDGTQAINNEKILCEFRSLGTNFYVAYADYDIDNDGDRQHANHNQPTFYDGYYNQLSLVDYDLGYRLWGLFETIKPEYEDKVITSKNTYDQYENIDITVLASTLANQNYLYIYNATYVLLDTFNINSYSSYFIYNAVGSGTLHLNLTRSSVIVATKNLTITAKDYDYLIYTVPNPSKPQSVFDVNYIYNNSEYSGILFVYDNQFTLLDSWYLINNSATLKTFSYAFLDENIYYFRMVVNISAYEKEVKYTHLHHVGVTVYANEIKVSAEMINLGDEVTIFGTHNFLNGDIYVKIADEHLRYVGASNTISFIYRPLELKEYVCDLIQKVSDTEEYIFYTTTFTCIGEAPVIPPDDIFGIPSEYVMAMGGAFITLGFLLIPFGLSKGKATNMIYAIFGGIGLGVSTIAGLFPLWLPFMITILVVAVMVFEYKKS